MKIIKADKQRTSSLVLAQRGAVTYVDVFDDKVTFKLTDDGEEKGMVIFDKNEIPPFVEMLKAFFPQGLTGALNYDIPRQSDSLLPCVRIQGTNWGEPFEKGVEVEFSDDFEDYMTDNLYFEINDGDTKSLLRLLQQHI